MYRVPSYTEISHFRAPYKDSLMGFGALPGAGTMGALKGGTPAVGSRPQAAAPSGASAFAAPQKKAGKPKSTMGFSDVGSAALQAANQLSFSLTHYAKVALLGADERLWSAKIQPTFAELQKAAMGIAADPKSPWRVSVRDELQKLANMGATPSQLTAAASAIQMLAEKTARGFAFQAKITGTALDPQVSAIGAQAYVKGRLKDASQAYLLAGMQKPLPSAIAMAATGYATLVDRAKSIPDVFMSPAAAMASTTVCISVPEVKPGESPVPDFILSVPGAAASLPKTYVYQQKCLNPAAAVAALNAQKQAASMLLSILKASSAKAKLEEIEAKIKAFQPNAIAQVSAWPLTTRIAIEDGLKADAAATKAKQKVVIAKSSATLGAGAKASADKDAQKASAEAQAEADKAAASLAKAQQENDDLRASLELATSKLDELAKAAPPAAPPVDEETAKEAEQKLATASMAGGRTLMLVGVGAAAVAALYFLSKKKAG